MTRRAETVYVGGLSVEVPTVSRKRDFVVDQRTNLGEEAVSVFCPREGRPGAQGDCEESKLTSSPSLFRVDGTSHSVRVPLSGSRVRIPNSVTGLRI